MTHTLQKVLLTGAAGFIGFATANQLLDAGVDVVGVDNLNNAYDQRVKHWRLRQLQAKENFTFVEADICDYEAMDALFSTYQQFDAVVNLAARAGVRASVLNPWVYFQTNTTGTLNLLELCRTHGIDKFVLASTSSLYGDHNPVPYQEDADTSKVLSPYAASKKAAEVICYTYHQLYDIDVTIFRYFTVYGPAGRPDMSVFRFIQWVDIDKEVVVFGDGTQSRDFTFVDDIARGTIAGITLRNGYEIINLGGDQPTVLNDMLSVVEELVGKEANVIYQERHMADMTATWANVTKANTLLGWRPRVSLVDGIARTVAWYRENEDFTRQIETGENT